MSHNEPYAFKRDEAYQSIKQAIIKSEYEPNTILYETSVCKTLGMSRTPVREALMHLADEGLVQKLPNNGFVVKVATLKEIGEIYDLRLCLERYVVEEIFNCQMSPDLTDLERLMTIQDKELAQGNYWEVFETNRLFHIEFVKFINNGTLLEVMQSLREKPIQSGFHALRNNALVQEGIDEHWDILESLKSMDKERTMVNVTNHNINSKKRLLGLNLRTDRRGG